MQVPLAGEHAIDRPLPSLVGPLVTLEKLQQCVENLTLGFGSKPFAGGLCSVQATWCVFTVFSWNTYL